ncbi:Teneurin-3, partial [Characodon lateralis]|nr:Teneurin-3 [Characodon lateralis]
FGLLIVKLNCNDSSNPHSSIFLLSEQPSNHHGSTLPPVPPPHRQQPSVTALNQALGSTHHAGQNLNLSRQLSPPSGSPAPVAGQSPAELQTTPPESVPLQDSWVLGSNVPLETRHFLFKTGTGTTPLFSTATPGYTMATGSVYSPPTRPLPRHTLSRSAFKFKKSSKYCSWR